MSLYGNLEEVHSIELQRTAMAVQEAERAIDIQRVTVCSSSSDGRDALLSGDRISWTAAKLQREIAEWKQQRLQEVRRERQTLNEEARKQYAESRLQSEQMKTVVNTATAKMESETGRRTQAALDDRFLSRRRWTDSRDALRVAAEMNKS